MCVCVCVCLSFLLVNSMNFCLSTCVHVLNILNFILKFLHLYCYLDFMCNTCLKVQDSILNNAKDKLPLFIFNPSSNKHQFEKM